MTTYRIQADNADPDKAEEWAVYATDPNCHDRRVAVTTRKSEADAVLLGLNAAPNLLAACEGFINRWETLSSESANLMERRDLDNLARAATAIRLAIARAKGEKGGGE